MEPDLAVLVAQQVAATHGLEWQTIDSTKEWLDVRLSLAGTVSKEVPAVKGDSHLHFVDSIDAKRDPKRAADFKFALAECRRDAASGKPLDVEMVKWMKFLGFFQGIGRPIDPFLERHFRHLDAYAKGGRERYPITYCETFDKCLQEACNEEAVDLRAVGIFLDVCFFDPLHDCNGRMARLAFDFVLSREGLTLESMEPIFLFGSESGAVGLDCQEFQAHELPCRIDSRGCQIHPVAASKLSSCVSLSHKDNVPCYPMQNQCEQKCTRIRSGIHKK